MLHAIETIIIVALLLLAGQKLVYSDIGEVRVLEHTKYTDASGLLHVAGLVENNTEQPIGFVRVTAYLFDAQGNQLPKYSTLTLIRTVLPGHTGPFDIPISDQIVGSKVASYRISLEWKIAQEKPTLLNFSDVKTYAVTHMDPSTFKYVDPHEHSHEHSHKQSEPRELHAHTETSGHVLNSGDVSTKWVKVVAVWYDKQGNFARIDWQVASTRLAPGEEGVFVIMTHKAMGYYSLFAESDDYLAILTDGNGRVMPVYEAPKATSLAMDEVRMSDISFLDENNKPTSFLSVGHQVQLKSTIESNLNTPQKFVSIFQISDKDGMTVMLSWIASEISAGGTADISVSWIPDSEGAYSIQTFLWQGIANAVPLSSEVNLLVVNVSA